MGQIAVDVVLLPDEVMTNRAIEINRRLTTNSRSEIVLGREDRLPHISLAMGCLDEAKVPTIGKQLEEIARRTPVRALQAVGVIDSTNAHGQTTSLLDVERTPELQALHEEVMEATRLFFRYDVTEAMIYDDAVAPSTLDWIRTYPEKAAYEHFYPHITLGYGQAPTDLALPIPFTATRLALCHLGNHATCRRVLTAASIV